MIQQDYVYNAKVLRVIDGDTIDVNIDLGFRAWRVERLRFLGIDTPELTAKDVTIRETAVKAKNFVQWKVDQKDIVIRTHKSDSFGRWLAEIYYMDGDKQINLCEQLIAEGLAVPYKP